LGQRQSRIHRFEASKQVPNRLDRPFDLALVFGPARAGRIDKTAVMLRHISVQRIQVGIIQIGFNHPAFQAVDYKNLAHPAPEDSHVYMRAHKTLLVLPPHKLHILVPAPGQGADKGVDHAVAPRLGIVEQTHLAIINLGLQPGRGFTTLSLRGNRCARSVAPGGAGSRWCPSAHNPL